MAPPEMSLLEEVLSPRRVFQTRARSKQDILEFLINSLIDCGEVSDLEGLRAAIYARESLMSTGIGLGIGWIGERHGAGARTGRSSRRDGI